MLTVLMAGGKRGGAISNTGTLRGRGTRRSPYAAGGQMAGVVARAVGAASAGQRREAAAAGLRRRNRRAAQTVRGFAGGTL